MSNRYYVTSDRSLLLSILQNFVANAIRYTDSGSIILFCRLMPNHQLKIEIKDSGQGIDLSQQKIIFEAFKQLENENKGEGVGLGLAIAQQAAELLGHEITLKSALNKGSSFALSLPRYFPSEETKDKKINPKLKSIDGLKVVCVDNDEEILNATESLLKRWGISVTLFGTSDDFINAVDKNEQFDVVLMDYQLGCKDNGFDLLKYYQSKAKKEFYGMLVTAEQDLELKSKIQEHGFKFLAKPVEPAKLRSLFQSFITR